MSERVELIGPTVPLGEAVFSKRTRSVRPAAPAPAGLTEPATAATPLPVKHQSGTPTATKESAVSRRDEKQFRRFVEEGLDEVTATMLAEGRNPRTDTELAYRLELWQLTPEGKAFAERHQGGGVVADLGEAAAFGRQYESARALGLSESAALEFARGHGISKARAERLLETHLGRVDDETFDMADSFASLGLSESAARHAARGRR